MNGIRMRLETKPGKSCASAGSLPSSRASATIAAAVSSEVWTARITSTSFSTGTGLKKCMPITRSGRVVAAASDVIGIERRVRREDRVRGQTRVGAAEDVLLHGGVLDDRLDHQVGGDEVVDGLDAAEHLVRVRRRPSRRASPGSCASSRGRARSRRGPRRAARRGGPRRRRPARCRRPSGRRRRRGRARRPPRQASASPAAARRRGDMSRV